MTAQYLYEAGLQATSEDITDRVRLYTLDVTQNAEEGSVALSTITIDDPDGDYEIKGFRRIRIYETEASASSNALMANLWVVDRKVIRGPMKTLAGRQWVCSVADMNSVPEFRILTGSSANRPAETDVARIQWLMTTNELGSRVTNSQYINTSGPVAMDAVDYRGQKVSDVINDAAQQSGKNWFTYTIEGVSLTLGLWYDFADSTSYTSDIKLTNDLDDVEADPYGLVYLIADDTSLERDPSRVYSGAFVQYDGGTVYREDLGISNEFTRRDAVVPADNVKSYNKAIARGDRYLSSFDTEEDRITTAIRLPAAKVNFVREGMRVRFRATHLPGYESYVWQRVMKRTIKQDSETEYLVTLELSTGPSVVTGAFVQDATNATIGQGIDVILEQDPTPGNLLVAFLLIRSDPPVGAITQTGWTAVPSTSGIHIESGGSGGDGDLYAYYKIAEASDTTTIHLGDVLQASKSAYVVEFAGVTTLSDSAVQEDTSPTTPISVGPATLSGASAGIAIGALIVCGPGVAGGNTHANVDLTGSYVERHNSDTTNQTNPDANTSLPPMYVVGYELLTSVGDTTMTATYQQGTFAQGLWGGILMVFR